MVIQLPVARSGVRSDSKNGIRWPITYINYITAEFEVKLQSHEPTLRKGKCNFFMGVPAQTCHFRFLAQKSWNTQPLSAVVPLKAVSNDFLPSIYPVSSEESEKNGVVVCSAPILVSNRDISICCEPPATCYVSLLLLSRAVSESLVWVYCWLIILL